MKTRTTEFRTTVLTADKGMTIVNEDYSVMGKEIYLGCNDPVENYREITDDEAHVIQDELDREAGKPADTGE